MRTNLLIISMLTVSLVAFGQEDQLKPNLPGAVIIEGRVGAKMDSCIRNGVMAVDYGLYSAPFRDHGDDTGPKFQGDHSTFTDGNPGYPGEGWADQLLFPGKHF